MEIVLFLSLLVAAHSATAWGEVLESNDDRVAQTISEFADDYLTEERRTQHMEREAALIEDRKTCLAEGGCPELAMRQSEGFIPCVDGLINSTETDPIPCWNVDQQAFMNFDDLLSGGDTTGNDIWGWTDPDTGIEYALMGMSTGTTIVNIQDPNVPVAVAFLPSTTGPVFRAYWRDIKVVNDWAFIVSEALDHGIQGFDLTRLRTIAPGSTVAADYTLGPDQGSVSNCHNIVGNDDKGKIYAVGCTNGTHCADNGGLFIVDVSDPANPVLPFEGYNCYADDGYVHDAQCVNYTGPHAEYIGKDICFCFNEDTLTIVDAEDPYNIQMLSRTTYVGAEYTHQGWLTEDQTVLLMDDEFDERETTGEMRTYVWDVRDLEAPVLMNTHYHGIQSVDHNQYILGDLVFQANIRSGLAILRVDQTTYTLDKVAYFDVFPTADTADFGGAWSVYPFFASGNLVVTSSEYGMYVVRYTGS